MSLCDLGLGMIGRGWRMAGRHVGFGESCDLLDGWGAGANHGVARERVSASLLLLVESS
jgi:hypothetical protein